MITIFFYITLLFVGVLVYSNLRHEKKVEAGYITEIINLHHQLEMSKKEEQLAAMKYKREMINEAVYYSQKHDSKLGLTIIKCQPGITKINKNTVIVQNKAKQTFNKQAHMNVAKAKANKYLKNQDKIA